MGLLDDLYIGHNANFGGQGGGLLDFLRTSQMQQDQYQPSAGFPQPSPLDNAQWPYGPNNGPSPLDNAQWPSGPNGGPSPLDTAQWPYGPSGAPSAPASFADRFNAMPGAPQPFQGSGRRFDTATFDPATYAPNQAQPIAVGSNYQMPRMGTADQFTPPMNAQAALPPNAQPTQGQLPPQQAPMQTPAQSQGLPYALGGRPGGFLDSLNNGLQSIGSGGSFIGALTGNRTDPQSIAQQNLKSQFETLRDSLIRNGETQKDAESKAYLAVVNPKAAETVLPEALTNKAEWGVVREDPISGAKVYGWIDKNNRTINGQTSATGASPAGGNGDGYLNKGVKEIDQSLPGDQYLQQFAPDVQSAIKAFARGDSTPTGNARKGWAENIKKWATAWGDKTGQQVNDQTFFEKKKLKTDLGASGNSSMGGILDNGESSFAHLAELGKSFADLGSVSHNFPGGGYIAYGQNALGSALGGSDTKGKIVAAKQNLTKYGQESTKFYAGTGGGVEERLAALKTVPPESSSGEEQAAYMEKEKQLMLDRLNNKFDHIRQTLGDEEGNKVIAKKLPTINKNIATIDESIKKLRGEAAPTQSASPDRSAIEAEMRKRGLLK